MQAMIWRRPAGGFVALVDSSVSTKPLSPDTVRPSDITIVTIRSVAAPHSLLVFTPGSTVPVHDTLTVWPGVVGTVTCSCAQTGGAAASTLRAVAVSYQVRLR